MSLSRFAMSSGSCSVSPSTISIPLGAEIPPVGRYRAACTVPANLLNEGLFMVDVTVQASTRSSEYATCVEAGSFYVIDDMKPGGVRGDWEGKWFNSILRPRFKWEHFGPTSMDAPIADQDNPIAISLHARRRRMAHLSDSGFLARMFAWGLLGYVELR